MTDVVTAPLALTREQVRGIILWGAIGGTLPTLGKIAGTFGADFNSPVPNLAGVAIALALYALIGGVISRAVGNPDMRQSLFAGIAAPAIVVSVLAGAAENTNRQNQQQSSQKTDTAKKGAYFDFVSTALAQSNQGKSEGRRFEGSASPVQSLVLAAWMERPARSNKMVILHTSVTGGVPIADPLSLALGKQSGQADPVIKYTPAGMSLSLSQTKNWVLEVPQQTTSIKIGDKTILLAPEGDTNITLQVKPKTTLKNDFIWALGGKREFAIGDISATVAPLKDPEEKSPWGFDGNATVEYRCPACKVNESWN